MSFVFSLAFIANALAGSICSDGWVSGSTGQGTCSHHGGIAGDSSYYYPSYGQSYSAPSPSTVSTLVTDYGHWEVERTITNSGDVAYTLTRSSRIVSSDETSFTAFDYTCLPYGDAVVMYLRRAPGYIRKEPFVVSTGDNSQVWVFSVQGTASDPKISPIYSWEAEITDNGVLMLTKESERVEHTGQVAGVYFLNSADILTLESSMALEVLVAHDGSRDVYMIPMDGFATAVKSFKASGCSAR